MDLSLTRLIDPGADAHLEDLRHFLAATAPVSGPADEEQLRAVRAEQAARAVPVGGRAVERVAEVEGRRVPVRVTLPENVAPRGVHLEIHGGGFYLGPGARNDARHARMADALGMAVVGVHYRLAPEHPWPAAPEDCETAALWLAEQGETLFGTDTLTIGGASAGANLALVTLSRLRRRTDIPYRGAVLRYGAYDLGGRTPGGRRYAEEYFIRAYAGHVTDRTDPDLSPLYADLRDLPPALMIVGTADILLEDNLALAGRLSAAGGIVDLRVYPEAPHGFTSSPTGMATLARRGMESWILERIGGR